MTVLGGLPSDLRAYLFVVQHIHPNFTPMLARRLAEQCSLPVVEARDGELARPGTVSLAPGGAHLSIERGRAGPILRLVDAPPRHGVRPCADILFGAVASVFGPRAVAVVLTGMGSDGLEGCRAVRARGGLVLAEAAETCVVFGMPRALVEAGVAHRVVPVGAMAAAIVAAVGQIVVPGALRRRRIARRLGALSRSIPG
jgi:two-component system chemotaxis response regulator CheB